MDWKSKLKQGGKTDFLIFLFPVISHDLYYWKSFLIFSSADQMIPSETVRNSNNLQEITKNHKKSLKITRNH